MLRRPKPFDAVQKLLDHEDRVVSWAMAGTDVVVASRVGLWWPAPAGPRLIGWHLISKAVWDAGRLRVIEARLDELVLIDLEPVSIELTEPRDLPPTVRKRVEASVAETELIALPGGAGRFVARRIPGQDGLTWWCRLEPGTPDGPGVRAAIADIVEMLSEQTTVIA